MDAGAVLHLRAAAPPQRRQGPGQQNIFLKPLKIFFTKIIFPLTAWRGAEVAGLAAGEDPGAEADTGERGPGQEVAHTQPREGEARMSVPQL